jgi:hypothetical protein
LGHGAVTPVQDAAERVRLDADNVEHLRLGISDAAG